MKVVLYAAVSVDGFIARLDDSTPWSDEEWLEFEKFVKSCDACIMGRRTHEIMRQDGLVEGPDYYVLTEDEDYDAGSCKKLSAKSAEDLPRVEKLGVIGGAETFGFFLSNNLVDEVILDIESIVLGAGKPLGGSHHLEVELELMSSRQVSERLIQCHYQKVQR